MTAGGYFGRALVVDVSGTSATGTPLELPEDVLRAYLGGVGLGTWLLHRLTPERVDPLAPEAPLAFVFSPLVGTPLTTSAKFAVLAKSPLTGLLTDALASSQFAIAGKLTGHDAIVVRGRAAELSVLLVDADGVRLEPAPELAGLPAAEAETAVRERFGRGWRTAAIGGAGERGVRYATISHDGRHAGRGGLGAVLGAKNVKAVLVKSGTRVDVADSAAVLAKSPLTGLLTDALASSQFAIAGKLTGHDAIVVRGRAAQLSVLLVDADGVRLEPAPELAGMPAAEAESAVRERFGRGWRTAAIGSAGERGVRYATISHDGRHAGRGGLGAVLGAKNVKAVLVRSGARVDVADSAAVLAAAKDLRQRSFGPATAKYRELGTLANLLAFNAVSTLPTRNFTAATFAEAPRLAAE
ncbi:MAG TPA: aldehyde ferredoxin oxidoreductase N-terminal domain-containing protein, partial [Pseudonocardia sp.]|nr:aldehyde ferredoxin oxidoreductase N-terminal domain-containing protein [Pseudonocardia sp.]